MAEVKRKSFKKPLIIVLLVAVVVLIWENRDVFSSDPAYLAFYYDIKGLQPSSPVQIKGVRVGKIEDIDLNGKGRVKVMITLNEDIPLPEGTVAYLASGGLTGEKIIELKLGESERMLQPGATLVTAHDSSVMQPSTQLSAMLATTKMILESSDSTLRGVNDLFSTGFLTSTTYRLITIEENSRGFAEFARSMSGKTDDFCKTVNNVEKDIALMAANNPDRTETIRDINRKTGELAGKDIAANVKSIRSSINSLKQTLKDARNHPALDSSDMYEGLTKELDTLNRSTKSTYENPPEFSIFGKSK